MARERKVLLHDVERRVLAHLPAFGTSEPIKHYTIDDFRARLAKDDFGCSDLSESDVDDILALLEENGLASTKAGKLTMTKKGLVLLTGEAL